MGELHELACSVDAVASSTKEERAVRVVKTKTKSKLYLSPWHFNISTLAFQFNVLSWHVQLLGVFVLNANKSMSAADAFTIPRSFDSIHLDPWTLFISILGLHHITLIQYWVSHRPAPPSKHPYRHEGCSRFPDHGRRAGTGQRNTATSSLSSVRQPLFL